METELTVRTLDPVDDSRRWDFTDPVEDLHGSAADGVSAETILTPDDAQRRIVNSMMAAPGESEEIALEQVREFVATEAISRKFH